MSTVFEIESAIKQLPKGDFWKLAHWFDDVRQANWEEQMQADAEAGKLDFLFDEAASARGSNTPRSWPQSA